MLNSVIIIQRAYRNTDICGICLNLVIKDGNCHSFHKKCIKKWNNHNCPICRKNSFDIELKYSTVKILLIVAKKKLKEYIFYKKTIINDHVYLLIKQDSKKMNMSCKKYIESQIGSFIEYTEKNCILYLRKRLMNFTRTKVNNKNPVRILINSVVPNYYNVLYHLKTTVKMCKIILSGYHNRSTGCFEDASNFLTKDLSNFLRLYN